ncbi:MAG TPA: tagaturonate epimerase family protein [Sedimentisphaerales bacterium]|nr:tagaturonate epimerase family protein [Sedimentisphaerales bacterium]
MNLEKYSFGIGDRFGHQGRAQLQAIIKAKKAGVDITPVWNKSHREHTIIGTAPPDVRSEADAAVKTLGWGGSYRVDADHIGLKNVDLFIKSSDFFTLDVADFIGKPADKKYKSTFVKKYKKYTGSLEIPGIDETLDVTKERVEAIADKFLLAAVEAGKIYRHIEAAKGRGKFITEVSMDETDQPQTPVEMLFILAALADERVPAQTIAPKFTGRFNKGVDYVGDVAQFAKEFEEDLAVIGFAVKEFGLPKELKLSVHSGSDKFSIYRVMNKALKKFNAGLHLKTAGTTWLEELIGLALGGGDGLSIAKQVYANAMGRFDELCGPYATVIDIDKSKLPSPGTVEKWSGEQYADALRHDQSCESYNPNFRQLLHVGYKVAAEMGDEFLDALKRYEETIAQNVTENIFERHIRPILMD